MEKNTELEIEITDITAEGSGVGRYDGMAVFVPSSAIGDRLKVRIIKSKKNYCIGKIIDIISPSEDRIEPDCIVSDRCGGCVYRHIDYNAEAKGKENRVKEVMNRIGGISVLPNSIIKAQKYTHYRNKAQYPVDSNGCVGFFASRSHRIITNEKCLLQPEDFDKISAMFTSFMKQHSISVYSEESKKGLVRHLYLRKATALNEIMVCVVINGESLPFAEELVSSLKDMLGERFKTFLLNINKKDTNVILGNKNVVLFGDGYITDRLCGNKIRISPLSFYQVNREMTEKLYGKVKDYASPHNKNIIDLYCGVGTIGLSLAKEAKTLIGVEIIKEAVEDAKINAQINGIDNARFICSDAKDAAITLKNEGVKADVVILDPPRKGCDNNVLQIVAADFSPEKIVYVSCDVATLARDCQILENLGYKVKEYTPVDLFPRTSHVETVALLEATN